MQTSDKVLKTGDKVYCVLTICKAVCVGRVVSASDEMVFVYLDFESYCKNVGKPFGDVLFNFFKIEHVFTNYVEACAYFSKTIIKKEK